MKRNTSIKTTRDLLPDINMGTKYSSIPGSIHEGTRIKSILTQQNDSMIKLRIETEIKKPVKEVYSTFINRTLMPKWQPGLLSDEAIGDKKGKKRFELKLNLGRRNMIMTETILKNEFPEYHALYELKRIKNEVHNRFEKSGEDATRWTYSTEFRFRGIMMLVGLFMRTGLEQQSKLIMKNFKNFVEKQ